MSDLGRRGLVLCNKTLAQMSWVVSMMLMGAFVLAYPKIGIPMTRLIYNEVFRYHERKEINNVFFVYYTTIIKCML